MTPDAGSIASELASPSRTAPPLPATTDEPPLPAPDSPPCSPEEPAFPAVAAPPLLPAGDADRRATLSSWHPSPKRSDAAARYISHIAGRRCMGGRFQPPPP